jgi:predicted dithiol-disulfide oxidoreductase (DUF899 family)
MKTTKMALPKVVSRAKWLATRNALLIKEKEATRARDALNAEPRRLPMVRIEKNYVFEGPGGKASLLDLFEGRRQFIIYHFMYHAHEDRFCDGCSFFVDQVGQLAHLHARDTSFIIGLSRAAREDRVVQEADGLDRPVVLLICQRLQ